MKSQPSQSQRTPVQPLGSSCRCNTVATRNRYCLLDGHSAPDLAIGTNNTASPAGKSGSEMVKVAAVSSEAMHAQNCAISSRRSPIREGDAVKAPPRQAANRSRPIRNDRSLCAGYCGIRRRSPGVRAIKYHLSIRRQTGGRQPTSRRYEERHCGEQEHRPA